MNQLVTQIVGIALALTTAIGCIAYEKLVKGSSYFFVGAMVSLSYIPFWLSSLLFKNDETNNIPYNKWWLLVFLLSGCTGPFWYWLTREKCVLTGAVFEVKYIAVLVLFSIFMGSKGITTYTVLGAILAMASIYFISK
jgi:drug/metabolite transporter (DMT)-like permease